MPSSEALSRVVHDPAALLECAGFGLLVLDPGSRVIYANAAGRSAVASGTVGLRFDGPFAAPSEPGNVGRWRCALAACAAGSASMIRLDRRPASPCLSLAPDPSAGPSSRVLCSVPASDAQRAASLRAYGRAHGLTDGETEVLKALASGASPKSIAGARGVAECTVRAQIRAILSKTGHRGTRELAIDAQRSAPLPFDRSAIDTR
jgi:DNA-binding CsgD family transcriptional regulator